jgi:hypothetical protein
MGCGFNSTLISSKTEILFTRFLKPVLDTGDLIPTQRLRLASMNTARAKPCGWCFSRRERLWLAVALCGILAFGANLEKRTALRRVPMTDLGVFACAAWAGRSGDNLYTVCDWHGWHYQYPPTLAILFAPLGHPVPSGQPNLPPGVERTEFNTPWGYGIDSHRNFYGLHEQNARFFCIVAVWYFISIMLTCLSAHVLGCALEGCSLRTPPPIGPRERRSWWALRTLPLLVCAGSLGTELSRGQVDVVMLASIAFGLYLAAAGSELRAGLCLSFPAAIKLFPPLLLLYPIWRRRWRMTAGVVAGLVLTLAILPAVALGPKRTIELYDVWTQVLAKPALGQGTDISRAHELTGMAATDNQSLLAFIHNWRYHNLPRKQRPPEAAPAERHAVYWIGGLMLLGVGLALGIRRKDSPQELLIIAGLLIGMAFVVSPIVHNYYYLLLLPLVAALLDRVLTHRRAGESYSKLLVAIGIFALTDSMARLPTIGCYLRDLGVPFLSMAGMLWVGAIVLLKQPTSTVLDNTPSS